MEILLVEDEPDLGAIILKFFTQHQYIVDRSATSCYQITHQTCKSHDSNKIAICQLVINSLHIITLFER